MEETQMTDAIRMRLDQLRRISDGIYVFNDGGRYGTIKNYQQDEEHYEAMFDGLTREQVVELFGEMGIEVDGRE